MRVSIPKAVHAIFALSILHNLSLSMRSVWIRQNFLTDETHLLRHTLWKCIQSDVRCFFTGVLLDSYVETCLDEDIQAKWKTSYSGFVA